MIIKTKLNSSSITYYSYEQNIILLNTLLNKYFIPFYNDMSQNTITLHSSNINRCTIKQKENDFINKISKIVPLFKFELKNKILEGLTSLVILKYQKILQKYKYWTVFKYIN